MRNFDFWTKRLEVAKQELSLLPANLTFQQEPLLRNYRRRKFYNEALKSWLIAERRKRAWVHRRARLEAQMKYFEEQLDNLSSRNSRILRRPVI